MAMSTITKSDLINMGCDADHVDDWFQTRKDKRAPKVTQSILKGIIKQAELAGVTLPKAIELSAENGWRGFKADWLANLGSNVQKQNKNAVSASLRNIHDTNW
jgi:hypothetical protein